MAKNIKYLCAAAALALVGSTNASAAPLTVTSYSTPNGDGQASGGSYNYWDLNYSGSGAKTTDGAALTGGTGDLTDGITTSSIWLYTENGAGTGPYVGWYAPVTLNPVVTFNFAGSPTISAIDIYLDNSTAGGVFAPAAILIDGVSTAFTAPPAGTSGLVSFTGLGLAGGSHTIEFQQQPGDWVFVDEVSFFGSAGSAVPEPSSWGLMILGFGLVGGALRHRSATVRVAYA